MPSAAQDLDRSHDDSDDSTVKIDMRALRRAKSQPAADNGATMEIDLSATQMDSLLVNGEIEASSAADDESTVELPALKK